MNQTAKSILLYDVREFEPQMQDMSAIIVEAARITAEAMPLLRSLGNNSNRLHGLTERLRSEEHPSELQSLMRISSAGFCLKKTTTPLFTETQNQTHQAHKSS